MKQTGQNSGTNDRDILARARPSPKGCPDVPPGHIETGRGHSTGTFAEDISGPGSRQSRHSPNYTGPLTQPDRVESQTQQPWTDDRKCQGRDGDVELPLEAFDRAWIGVGIALLSCIAIALVGGLLVWCARALGVAS